MEELGVKKCGATWIDINAPLLRYKLIVTVSMEGYIPEFEGDAREANTKGGLGIYFGDKLEGLAAIGIRNAFGCMPMYHKRLVQRIRNGRQEIDYREVSYDRQPVTPLLDEDRQPIKLEVWGINTENPLEEVRHEVEVFCTYRGGTPLYLFRCLEVFDVLYPDETTHRCLGRRHRFLQETIFAQCVPRLFRRLGVIPDALLINEGHVAVAGAITRGDPVFNKTAILYTNHTVVPAGLEVFDVDELVGNDLGRARYIMRFPSQSWQWLWKKFIVESEGKVLIDFSKGALEICSAANAVSAEHAGMTRSLFPSHNKHIHPILNGSGDTWVQRELLELERQGIQPSAEELLALGLQGKRTAREVIRRRTADLTNQQGKVIAAEGRELNLDMPAVWLVRRIVDYKSQYPILKEIIHVLCADRDQEVASRWGLKRGLGMQVVVGGVAPLDCHEQTWIEAFVQWMERPDLKNRFFFVPGGDTELLRLQAIGADICLNCPQPGREACGTSDQRSARNGGINIAVHSGGPPEYLEDGRSGMLIGPYINNSDFFDLAPKHILEKLEVLADMYYAQGRNDRRWREMKLQSYLASRQVSAAAMEQRYAPVYVQAICSRLEHLQDPESRHHVETTSDQYHQPVQNTHAGLTG